MRNKTDRLSQITRLTIFTIIFLWLVAVKVTRVDAAGEVTDLLQQGRVSTCLRAKWSNLPEVKGSKKVASVHLTGRCEAAQGCVCRLNQQPNGANAAEAEGNFGDEFCNERASIDNLVNNQKLARVLGVSTQLLAKWSPKPEMTQAEKDERNKKLRNRCQKAMREARDPVLGAVPVGVRKCNIIKNNLASAGSPKGINNVLGVSTDGIIPYGNVDIIVQEETYKHSPISFSAVGDNTPDVSVGSGESNGAGAGGDRSLKNALLSFITEVKETSIQGVAKDCAGITWDPYGRVFDAQTLEPIPDVIVDLMDGDTKQAAVMKLNLNYDVTGDDGLYNIQVENEGGYSLGIDTLSNHRFVKNPAINQLWKYIYSDLYNPEDIFVETQSTPTHHDIALEPVGEPFKDAVAKVVPGTLKSEDMNGIMAYTGRSTFPMALICLVNESTGNTVGECVHANNIGYFTIAIEKADVPAARLRVDMQKVDLTNPNLYNDDAEVQTLHMNSLMLPDTQSSHYFEPVLGLVEGYAYDTTNTVLPNATVTVVLNANKKAYFQTKADSRGFFTIYATNLPAMEYYLEYVDAKTGKTSAQTTSEFITTNKDYLNINQTDLVLAQKNNQPIAIKETQGTKLYEKNGVTGAPTQTPKPVAATSQYLNIAMIIASIIVLVLVGVGMAIRIKGQSSAVQ